MSEIIGPLISYVCQLAIILFVLKEFGIVSSPWTKLPVAETSTEGGGNSTSQFDIGGLMNGLMSGLQQPRAGEKKKRKKPVEESASGVIAEPD